MPKIRSFYAVIVWVVAWVGWTGAARAGERPKDVTFKAADGVVVYGDLYTSEAGKTAPIILLFHQAGANARAEYGTIIPRLIEHGCNVLAIDQRSGGSRLGGTNRTVEALGKKNLGYCDAYPDLEAALRYAVDGGFDGPRIVWGSSYSAGLVITLAVEHKEDVAGVLAFSPAAGGPMKACDPTPYVGRLTVPALALRPESEMTNASVREQLDAFKARGHRTYVAKNGVHGSSMLNPKRVDGSVEPTWKVVLAFIDSVTAE